MRTSPIVSSVLLALSICSASAQNGYIEQFERRRSGHRTEFRTVRQKYNDMFAASVRHSWDVFRSNGPVRRPQDEKVPPVVFEGRIPEEPFMGFVLKEDNIVSVPQLRDQPRPIEPVAPSATRLSEEMVTFSYLGMTLKARSGEMFRLTSLDGDSLQEVWLRMKSYDAMLSDCLRIRDERKLCDWAYLNMLASCSKACMESGNEATLLMFYLFCQSGYRTRLARDRHHLVMLYASDYTIYDMDYFKIDGQMFYVWNDSCKDLDVCNFGFPGEKNLSFQMDSLPSVTGETSELMTFNSSCGVTSSCSLDKNLIDFMAGYPCSQYGENSMTKWSIYANVPVSQSVKEMFYPSLQEAIRDKGTAEALNILLNFVQTAFAYGKDEDIWGGDRVFFAEETLFYPCCDCEDRSILFSRLVRDLMSLETVLVYYPGHLATAVAVNEDIPGDCLLTCDGRYLVCDPTCSGAPIGVTMKGMDNNEATVIKLRQ